MSMTEGAARRRATRWSGCRIPVRGPAGRPVDLVVISYVLERDRLAEVTPTWTAEDRHHARTQLESRRGALTVRLQEALRRAYGVLSPDDADLGARAMEQVLTLARIPEPRLLVGQG